MKRRAFLKALGIGALVPIAVRAVVLEPLPAPPCEPVPETLEFEDRETLIKKLDRVFATHKNDRWWTP